MIKAVCISILIMLITIYFALTTQLGSTFIIKTVAHLLTGQLTINKIEGNLASVLILQDVSYHTPQYQFEIKQISISWNPSAIINKIFSVNFITANHIVININSKKIENPHQENNAHRFILPKIPWFKAIFIKDFLLQDLTFNKQNKAFFHFNHITSSNNEIEKYTISFNGNDIINKKVIHGFGQIYFHDQSINIETFKIYNDNANISLHGKINQFWDMQWNVRIPNLNEIFSQTEGEIYSQGEMRGELSNPVINAKVEVHNLSFEDYKIKNLIATLSSSMQKPLESTLQVKINNLKFGEINFKQFILQMQTFMVGKSLIGNISSTFDNINHINGKINLPNFSFSNSLNQTLQGELDFKMGQLTTVLPSLPETKNIRGELSGKMHLAGIITKPEYKLDLILNNASADVPRYGVKLTQINLNGQIEQQKLTFSGSLHSGKGIGQVKGSIFFKNDIYPIQLELEGENLSLYHTNEYNIVASPKINLNFDDAGTEVYGTINVPYAKIKPKDYTSTVSLPNEVIFVNSTQESMKPPTLTLNLVVRLGKSIYIDYQNIRATITGELHINQQEGSPPTATGELHTINGKYKAYNQSLNITEGQLIYTGNLLYNPGLNIRATKKINTIETYGKESDLYGDTELEQIHHFKNLIVGVLVKGTLDKPIVTLFSQPSQLSQNDIISYLLFGYPQSRINNASGLALINNIIAANNAQNSKVGAFTHNVKSKLGLSKFTFGNTEYYDPNTKQINTGTTLTVGKKIGRRLSINYTTGVFNPVSIFELRYRINKRLLLKTTTSALDDTGADLVYEVEQN